MMVGGSFLEKFTFSLRTKCLGTTLPTAFSNEMTLEQYLQASSPFLTFNRVLMGQMSLETPAGI